MGKASKAEERKGNEKEGRSKPRKGKDGIEDEINPRAKGEERSIKVSGIITLC